MGTDDNPFLSPPPPEVPLSNAPLVRVIAQVRFPGILSIEDRRFVARFQEDLRAMYPLLTEESIHNTLVSPTGLISDTPKPVWRFSDTNEAWRVSLAHDFLALETRAYTSRADFISRLHTTLIALKEHIKPNQIDRLGLRYIDRITEPALSEINQLLRPEILGISATSAGAHTSQNVSQWVFENLAEPRAQLVTRWGHIPEGKTVDPAAIEPIDEPSWVLDLDMFNPTSQPFDIATLLNDATRYAERIYTFFRWSVTDTFLRRYGGNP